MRSRTDMPAQSGAIGAAAVLAVLGLAVLAMAGFLSLDPISVGQQSYNCGSVIYPDDPRDSVPRFRPMPPAVAGASRVCVDRRDERGRTASILLAAGAGLLVLALAAPAIQNELRALHRRRRSHV